MANLTNSNKLIGKFAKIESDISEIKESLPADGVGEGVITLGINDQGVGSFSVNQKNNEDINLVITRATVGLSNVNNTSDMDKPVSTAQQAALDLKADKSDIASVYKYKGSVASASELPTEGMNVGDVYNLEDTGMNVAWNGTEWDELGSTVDLSIYYNKDEVDNLLDQKADASDIPTVNDGTLDIQLNGTSVETFSANSENNKTANIEVTKSTVGLGNVDNTSDADKPISTATQAALDTKQNTLTAGTGITIENNVISTDGTGDVMYDDFKFVEMTGNTFENLSGYKTINANTNLLSGTNLKEGMQYVLYVTNDDSIAHMVTVDGVNQVEIPAGETKTLVYLATASDSLKLQTCEGGGGGGSTPGNGTIIVNQGGVNKGTFTVNQSTDTTIELDAISEDAMEYSDFNFVDKTGTTITLDLNSTITATNNFTVNAPAEIKDGQIYVLRVDVGGNTEFTMTLGTNITNPYNVDISLGTNTLSQFVFLAVDGKLELQPQLMTRVDVENILREYNLIP